MTAKQPQCAKVVLEEDEMVLSWIRRMGYGVGHFLNDLCSAMWFIYFLLYLTLVEEMSGKAAVCVLIVGQITDAVATPVIGIWSDRGNLGCLSKIGKRRSWYLLGSLAVVISMPFMYSPPISYISPQSYWLVIYYSAFVMLFQLGWAAVQTVHLALSTDLTPLESERTLLLSLRNTFTSIATLLVPSIFLIIEAFSSSEQEISSKDAFKFVILNGVVLVIGCSCSLFSGLTMKEDDRNEPDSEWLAHDIAEQTERRTYSQIFGKLDLYKVAVVYTSTRLFVNVIQTFVTLYVSQTLRLSAVHVAAVPLAVYSVGTVSSLLAERFITLMGRKVTYIIGMVPGVIAAVWMHFGPVFIDQIYFAYAVFSLYGVASCVLLVTAVSQTSLFIGMDIGNGAFVFGVMSFCDKMFSGMAIFIIEQLRPPGQFTMFYKDALAYTCGVAAIVGTIAILSIRLPSRNEVTDSSTNSTAAVEG